MASPAFASDCAYDTTLVRPFWVDAYGENTQRDVIYGYATFPIKADNRTDIIVLQARAKEIALADLTSNIAVSVKSEMRNVQRATDYEYSSHVTSDISVKSHLVLRGHEEAGYWIDPEQCVFYQRVSLNRQFIPFLELATRVDVINQAGDAGEDIREFATDIDYAQRAFDNLPATQNPQTQDLVRQTRLTLQFITERLIDAEYAALQSPTIAGIEAYKHIGNMLTIIGQYEAAYAPRAEIRAKKNLLQKQAQIFEQRFNNIIAFEIADSQANANLYQAVANILASLHHDERYFTDSDFIFDTQAALAAKLNAVKDIATVNMFKVHLIYGRNMGIDQFDLQLSHNVANISGQKIGNATTYEARLVGRDIDVKRLETELRAIMKKALRI